MPISYADSLQGTLVEPSQSKILIIQIVALADVFDTLIHERPYKRAWPVEKAVAAINLMSGRWFNPKVAVAFLQVLAEQSRLLKA